VRPASLLAGLSCLFVSAPAAAQVAAAGHIHGTVLDSMTGVGLAQAVVFLEGRAEVWSDERGRYRLEAVPPGEYLLAAVTRDCRIAAVRLTFGAVDSARVDLTVGVQRLAGAAAARTRDRAEGTGLKVVTREEIARMSGRTLPEILRRAAPSMVGATSSRPGASVRIQERGVSTLTGSRTPLLLLDGVRVADMRALEGIDPTTIARIEIGAGAVGGWQHGLDGASGVIHIHTHLARPAGDPYCGALSERSAAGRSTPAPVQRMERMDAARAAVSDRRIARARPRG
jgi:hypothetical protein